MQHERIRSYCSWSLKSTATWGWARCSPRKAWKKFKPQGMH